MKKKGLCGYVRSGELRKALGWAQIPPTPGVSEQRVRKPLIPGVLMKSKMQKSEEIRDPRRGRGENSESAAELRAKTNMRDDSIEPAKSQPNRYE